MTRILIIGASGQISQEAIELYLQNTDFDLTLLARDKAKLPEYDSNRLTVIEGDATDKKALSNALKNVDTVFVSSTGETLGDQAETIIESMDDNDTKRLIFVTALNTLHEVPGKFGEWNDENIGPYLAPFREATEAIENSDLDYTIFRPAWLTNYDEVDYEVTRRDEPFKGTEVSRKSVADLAVKISQDPKLHSKENIGLNKPDTDGDKPSWM
ncbi:SDR family oxidoreductase [Salinicoccus carnicancri]|uniref:SDR family oxidoreductase n=1 Tax=Salinicoccus carnicancri TaxID=558170 RepID=UPI00035EEA27|nr:SDR family oxidoreductase [Salinicoccus carnicancri]